MSGIALSQEARSRKHGPRNTGHGPRLLRQHLRRKSSAAGRRSHRNSQEACANPEHRPRFSCRGRRSVDRGIIRIHIGRGSLQDDADRAGCSAEDGLPTHGVPLIGQTGRLGNRKLCASRSIGRKRLGVEAEPDVSRKQRKWRCRVAICRRVSSWVSRTGFKGCGKSILLSF